MKKTTMSGLPDYYGGAGQNPDEFYVKILIQGLRIEILSLCRIFIRHQHYFVFYYIRRIDEKKIDLKVKSNSYYIRSIIIKL
jgi:hypothetical protein